MSDILIPLTSYELLCVSGSDSKRFLQGQLSCNVDHLSPEQSLTGALCNLKGRVIADFRLLEFDNECQLLLQPGMAGIVKKVLDKYIVFFKASTGLLANDYQRLGLIGEQATVQLNDLLDKVPQLDGEVSVHDSIRIVKIPGLLPRYEIWLPVSPSDEQTRLLEKLQSQSSQGTETDWLLGDFGAGIVHIDQSMTEQYLPQSLNYDISGVINFNKGCYTGQEIVVRMFYRSAAKKRLFHLVAKGCHPEDARGLHHIDGDTTAEHEIIQILVLENGDLHLMAILPVEAVERGEKFRLHNATDVQLDIIALPYMR
jgi:tRNA-modifying protein YgfZ